MKDDIYLQLVSILEVMNYRDLLDMAFDRGITIYSEDVLEDIIDAIIQDMDLQEICKCGIKVQTYIMEE